MVEPYYQDGSVTIYHGDCHAVLPWLESEYCVVTDPPYGIGWNCDYSSWCKAGPKAQGGDRCRSYPAVVGDDRPFDPRFLFRFTPLVIWGAPCFMEHLPNGSLLVWHKRNSHFLAQAEAAWMDRGHGVHIYSQPVESIQADRVHPTQKPVGLMKWCIGKAGGARTILDPFMGTGTTLRAAKELNRTAIGIEIEERYCEIAAKRMRQEVLDLAAV